MTNLAGQLLGNYRLSRLLGQGGFADVYLGEHIHLGRQAAIKVLRTQLTGEDVMHFRNEARTIANLTHPHIVQVLDFGVEKDVPFLVMIYAPGGTLRQCHPRGVLLAPQQVAVYVRQVASALQYAHDHKVIHRDIKPENMLLGPGKEVLLSDFGIALVTPSTRTQRQLAQSTFDTVGTVTYMAPEQIQGKPLLASDQYALGVVVYEWLTGRPPFEGSYGEIALKHICASPQSPRKLVPTLVPDVEQVVLTALAKEPQERFASIQAFATALEQACKGAHSGSIYPLPVPPVAEPAREAVLQGPSGPLVLGRTVVTIGRAPDNRVVINDAKVSGKHAEIRPVGQGHSIIDLHSKNGTYVNQQMLVAGIPHQLSEGDSICVGDTVLRYAKAGSPEKYSGTSGTPTFPPTLRAAGGAVPGHIADAPTQTGYGQGAVTIHETVPHMYPPQEPSQGRGAEYSHASQGVANPVQQPSGEMVAVGGNGTSTLAQQPSGNIPGQGGGATAGRPSRPKSRWLWFGLDIAAVLLLMASAVFAFVVYTLPTPGQALDTFCTTLRAKDYRAAYSELSSQFQSRVTEPVFASFFANTTSCAHSNAYEVGNMATANLMTDALGQATTDHVRLVPDHNNSWKIDDETRLGGLTTTLDSYCAALENGNYRAAYSDLSDTLRGKLPQDQFSGFFAQATSCGYSGLSMSNGGASINIITDAGMAQRESDLVNLVQENGNWKIDNFAHLPGKALDMFCSDLQKGDDQSAYNQFFNTFREGRTEADFAKVFSVFTTCTHDTPIASGGYVTATVTVGDKSGVTIDLTMPLVKGNDGTWQIAGFSSSDLTLGRFCDALQNRDYQTAYDQFTIEYQQAVTKQQFTMDLSNVASCYPDLSTVLGGTATATVTLSGAGGDMVKTVVTVTKETNGDWKISDLQLT